MGLIALAVVLLFGIAAAAGLLIAVADSERRGLRIVAGLLGLAVAAAITAAAVVVVMRMR